MSRVLERKAKNTGGKEKNHLILKSASLTNKDQDLQPIFFFQVSHKSAFPSVSKRIALLLFQSIFSK